MAGWGAVGREGTEPEGSRRVRAGGDRGLRGCGEGKGGNGAALEAEGQLVGGEKGCGTLRGQREGPL